MKIKTSPRFLLLTELLLTLCVCAAIAAANISIVRAEAVRYMSETAAKYAELENRYVSVFKAIVNQVSEKAAQDPSFDEMNAWLQMHDKLFAQAVGEKIYDGFAMTYKGGYAHSWNYGDYSKYDPQTRPWYQEASRAEGRVTVIAPYVTYLGSLSKARAPDANVELSIAQKHSEEISWELDLKTYDVSGLFSERGFDYGGASALLVDKKGYILSTNDKSFYCRNVYDQSDALVSLLGRKLKALDGAAKAFVSIRFGGRLSMLCVQSDGAGNDYCVIVPYISVFDRNVLPAVLIILLLVLLEICVYIVNKRSLAEMAARDNLITSISRGAFLYQAYVDLDTMLITPDEQSVGALPSTRDYREIYRYFRGCLAGCAAKNDFDALFAPEKVAGHEKEGFISKKFTFDLPAKDGRIARKTLALSLFVTRLGGKRTAYLLGNDMTEEERGHRQLAESIAHYYTAAVIGNAKTGEVNIIKIKSEFAAMFAQNLSRTDIHREFAARNLKEKYADGYVDMFSLDSIRRRLAVSESCSYTAEMKDGRWRTFLVIRCIGYEENGQFVFLIEDADEQMRSQQELSDALAKAGAAAEAKNDFLSRMSHDIRTPLNGIIGMAHLASEEKNPPATDAYLKKINTSSKFLLGLVNDILDMSKAESGKVELHPEPYLMADLNNYIDSVIRPLYEVKDQTFTAQTQPVSSAIPIIDILHFNQIIFNLLSNAVKYTPEGGHISLNVYNELVQGHREHIVITVKDDGVGISEEFQKVIFDPFTQEGRSDSAENRGSGLGLAIVKKMVDLMGGSISVKSKLGQGSAFTVELYFDYIEADQATWNQNESKKKADYSLLAGKHVLLCEDHPLNQEIATAMLSEQGMIVDVADNGQTGVEKFSRSVAGFFDVVLMDIRMPLMDGHEAARAIRALPRADAASVPIIAMTADAFSEDIKKCLDAGMNGHIAKPVEPEQLYGTIAAFLKNSAARS